MTSKARSAFRIVRRSAFVLMALMVLVRLGPLCETMAMAAMPTASVMMDCAGKSTSASLKNAPASTCAMPCAAVAGETIEHVEPIAFRRLSPWSVATTGLRGLTIAPATPPPQTV